ncbi:YqfQ family protein [Halobacillus litoralis]|uniref:YqfQ family protein n=1 Tax=Halobacillus litoralis TaxID=45668 RepID=UPI001CFC7BEE|nr:YqfQ family protein [Halobacillus litoralis]
MFPTGQPPFPPMGQFPGFQQAAAPQMMRSFAPLMNAGSRGFGGFGLPGFIGNAGLGSGVPGFLGNAGLGSAAPGFFGGGGGLGANALGAAGAAAKTGGAGWLGHMQTALKAMQTAAPMMQQYGPMLKNIPAMINMMKIMNEPDDEDETSAGNKESESISSSWESSTKKSSEKKKDKSQGTSQPKLFI